MAFEGAVKERTWLIEADQVKIPKLAGAGRGGRLLVA